MNTQFIVGVCFAGIGLIPLAIHLFASTALPSWFFFIALTGFFLLFIGIFLMAFGNPS
jgi:hypothetical protein